jgi:hypothetical protein
MVQAGRVACIFTPFALSIAALVCLVLVFLGGMSEHNNTLGSLYFFKVSGLETKLQYNTNGYLP